METVILWGAGNFCTIIDFSLTETGESGLIHACLAFTSSSTAMFERSMQITSAQFLSYMRALRGNGTQSRSWWNEPPPEDRLMFKSELMLPIIAYPSPGLKLTNALTLHIKGLFLAVFFSAG